MELQMQIELATQMLMDILSHVDDEILHQDGVEMVNFLYDISSKDISKNCRTCLTQKWCTIYDYAGTNPDVFSCCYYEAIK